MAAILATEADLLAQRLWSHSALQPLGVLVVALVAFVALPSTTLPARYVTLC